MIALSGVSMARPGQLAGAIAEVFDQDVATVRQQARLLRDAGHMSLEKAGRGAGTMTTRDAANLLIAVAGSSRVKYSNRPVEQHGACRSKEGAWILPFEGMPGLLALGPDHTFADTIEALLRAVVDGSVDTETGLLNVPGMPKTRILRVKIDMHEPHAMSEVRIGLQGRDEDGTPQMIHLVSRHYEVHVSDRGFDPPFQAFPISDLTHTHSFSEKALFRVAQEFRFSNRLHRESRP